MISRTLGLEFGGSIGTLFFLANVVGCAMAISGCVEGIMNNFGPGGYFSGEAGFLPDGSWWRFLFCTLINTSMLLVCLIGASLFAKTSVLILGIVTVCLLATYISFLAEGPKTVSPHIIKNTDLVYFTKEKQNKAKQQVNVQNVLFISILVLTVIIAFTIFLYVCTILIPGSLS